MPPDLSRLQGTLLATVGDASVIADAAVARALGVEGVSPSLVVRPGTQEEVQAVLAVCAQAGAAVIPWGGGTAQGLGNAPAQADVVVALDRLSRFLEHDAPNLTVSVEAGVRLADLQAGLAARRQFLPLDPPGEARASIGGILAANASGPSRLLYGTARDWVLGMRVVLPGGERIRCGGQVIKNVSGYDMNKLFIGSLGTLGIITEATFKLLPCPAVRASVIGLFPDLDRAAAVVGQAVASVLLPEALDLLNPVAVQLLGPALDLPAPAGYALAVALAGSPETVERQVRDFTRLFRDGGAGQAASLREDRSAWQAMREVVAASAAVGLAVRCRIGVPISRTAAMVAAAEDLGRRHGLPAVVAAHAGSGIIRAGYRWAADAVPGEAFAGGIEALREQAAAWEGSLVLEAAPPALKRQVDAWGKAGEALGMMQRLKAEFDPRGICNPGRFVGGI